MKIKTSKILLRYLVLVCFFSILSSCKEKDDSDYIIEFLKIAKDNDSTALKKYFSFDIDSEDNLYFQARRLIIDIKDADVPNKSDIKNVINDGEYQTYEFIIGPEHKKYWIGLYKVKKNYKVINLNRL